MECADTNICVYTAKNTSIIIARIVMLHVVSIVRSGNILTGLVD